MGIIMRSKKAFVICCLCSFLLAVFNCVCIGKEENMGDPGVKIYPQIGNEDPSEDYSVSVNGKPMSIRDHVSKVRFIDTTGK